MTIPNYPTQPADAPIGPLRFYQAFGLIVASELELPELPESSQASTPDLLLRRDAPAAAEAVTNDEPALDVNPGAVVFTFAGAGRFRILPQQKTIWCQEVAGSEPLARLPLLGPVMATYLHLQDRLVLHASAVRLPFGAAAFVGDKGAGKSTTAAALVSEGYELVTDDLLVCSVEGGRTAKCEPSFSQLKLNPDSATAIPLQLAEELPSPHPLFTKTQQRLPATAASQGPLVALCVLRRGGTLSVERLSRSAALGCILRFSYVLRYGETFLAGPAGARHFMRCAELANAAPAYVVTVPEALPSIGPAVRELVSRLERTSAEGQ